MPHEFEIIQIPQRHYVGVRRRVTRSGIGPLCAEVLPRVTAWLADIGSQTEGMPITVYHSVDLESGQYDLQPGRFVAEPVDGQGDITSGRTTAGEAAHAVHEGSYESLGETWEALWSWIAAQGRTVSQPAWEQYITDPEDDPDPRSWRTDICVPLD